MANYLLNLTENEFQRKYGMSIWDFLALPPSEQCQLLRQHPPDLPTLNWASFIYLGIGALLGGARGAIIGLAIQQIAIQANYRNAINQCK